MTVEMIDKMGFTLNDWIEILGVCEMVFNGLCELYCQKKSVVCVPQTTKKRPEQQAAARAPKFDIQKNFWYNINVRKIKILLCSHFKEAASSFFISTYCRLNFKNF